MLLGFYSSRCSGARSFSRTYSRFLVLSTAHSFFSFLKMLRCFNDAVRAAWAFAEHLSEGFLYFVLPKMWSYQHLHCSWEPKRHENFFCMWQEVCTSLKIGISSMLLSDACLYILGGTQFCGRIMHSSNFYWNSDSYIKHHSWFAPSCFTPDGNADICSLHERVVLYPPSRRQAHLFEERVRWRFVVSSTGTRYINNFLLFVHLAATTTLIFSS